MIRKIKSHKRIFALVMGCALLVISAAILLYANTIRTRAAYDRSKAVTFRELNAKKPVGEKYFFVGTYVYALEAATDDIYNKAIASQSDFNQFNNYYKSELAGGVWFDLADATDISSITDSGTKVEDAEVDRLYVTVFIDETGKVYDAKTLASKSLFDDPNPYDLSQIPELYTLHTQYQSSFSEDSKGVDKYYYLQLKAFFGKDLRDSDPVLKEQTDSLDRRLANLQVGYEALQSEGKNSEAEVVQRLMKQVDNTRRALIYKKLAIGSGEEGSTDYELNKLLMVLSNKAEGATNNKDDSDSIEQSTQPYDVWTNSMKSYTYDQIYTYMVNHDGISTVKDNDGNKIKVDQNYKEFLKDTPFEGATSDKEIFKQNDGIIQTLYQADSDCKATYNTLISDSITTPDSHIGKAISERELELYNVAESGYSPALLNVVGELVKLNSISDNVVKDKDAELAVINGGLFAECENGFASLVSGGPGDEYESAVAQGANDDGLNSALDSQEAKLNKEMTELQFIITAKRKRITTKECYNETLEWIDWTDSLTATIPTDAFTSKARIAVNSHKAWLTNLLDELAKEDASLQSEIDKLMAQKDELNAQKMQALDDNDLNGANKISAKLEEIDNLINEEIAKNSAKANDSGAKASERAAASVALNGTTEGAIQDIKQDAMEKLANGENIDDEMEALKQLGADDAINEINSAKNASDSSTGNGSGNGSGDGSGNGNGDGSGNGNGNGDGSGNGSGDGSGNGNGNGAGDGSGNGSGDGSGNGTGSGNGSGSGTNKSNTLSESDILAILADVLGGEFSELSDSDKIVAAVAIDWLGEQGNSKASSIAKNFIEICATEHNRFVYDTYTDGAREYISLKTVGNTTNYRYIYSNAGKEGTLAEGKDAYTFTNGSKKMNIESSDTTGNMQSSAKYMYGSLYVPEATSKEYFGMSAEIIDKADYSAAMNGAMTEKAKTLLEAFKNGGKQ